METQDGRSFLLRIFDKKKGWQKIMKTRQQEQICDFPYGWNKGDTCVMITNKAKKSTCEYTVESYDGRYFGVRSHTGLFHRASPQRLFHSKEEAVAALEQSETPTQERGGMTFQ